VDESLAYQELMGLDAVFFGKAGNVIDKHDNEQLLVKWP
jgi:hypothetical protein